MTMTQRFAGMLRRHACSMDKIADTVTAPALREAANHMEELEQKLQQARSPYQRMKTAPKDGTVILVLLEGSDVPKGARWLAADDDRATDGAGWYLQWDDYAVTDHDAPRYWMACPDDPEA